MQASCLHVGDEHISKSRLVERGLAVSEGIDLAGVSVHS